uniref:Putative ovule protein n=1 Tax=Solanum chacoense TaxID=4108 RepID=A0A0V0HIW9_SOLCH
MYYSYNPRTFIEVLFFIFAIGRLHSIFNVLASVLPQVEILEYTQIFPYCRGTNKSSTIMATGYSSNTIDIVTHLLSLHLCF